MNEQAIAGFKRGDGTLKPAQEMLDVFRCGISSTTRSTINMLRDKGVLPSELIFINYTFNWRYDMQQQSHPALTALGQQFPVLYPPAQVWQPGPANPNGGPGSYHDLSIGIVDLGDAEGVAHYLRAFDGQYPELRQARHVWQVSNCGGAYGYNTDNFEVLQAISDRVRTTGRSVEFQVEACNEEWRLAQDPVPAGPANAPWYVPHRDCKALNAIKAVTPAVDKIHVFDHYLYSFSDVWGWEDCQ